MKHILVVIRSVSQHVNPCNQGNLAKSFYYAVKTDAIAKMDMSEIPKQNDVFLLNGVREAMVQIFNNLLKYRRKEK